MSFKREQYFETAVENVRKKLAEEYLVRCEMDNPYVEQYIDVCVKAIFKEFATILSRLENDYADAIRRSRR